MRAFYAATHNFFSGGICETRKSIRQRRDRDCFGGKRRRDVAPPKTRTTERQRTENGHTRNDRNTRADGATARRNVVVTHDKDDGTRSRDVDYTGFEGKSRSVDSQTTKTDDGFTRSTVATNTKGETATRDLTVSHDKDSGLTTRSANYTRFDGREGSMTEVIQHTDGGFSRDTTRTLPDGATHTRSVNASCEKDVGKCVKQVEVDEKP